MFYLSQNKKLLLCAVAIFVLSFTTILFFVKGPQWAKGDASQLLGNILGAHEGHEGETGSKPAESGEAVSEEEFYRTLAMNHDDPLIVVKTDGEFTFLSDSFLRVLGYAHEEFAIKDIFSLMHPDDAAPFMKAFTSLIRDGSDKANIGPYRFKTVHAEYRVFMSSAKVIHDPEGPISYIIMTSKDITDSVKGLNKEKERPGKKIPQTEDGDGRIVVEKV